MFEIKLKESVPEKVIVETLSRIGIGNKKIREIFPSAYLYFGKDGKPFIAHFKEILAMNDDGFDNMTDIDYDRRDSIIKLLSEWNLVDLVDEFDTVFSQKKLFVLPFSEKKNWKIKHKVRMNY